MWEQFIEHKVLQFYKRQSLQATSLQMQIAEHVAAEMAGLDWQVTHPAPRHPGSHLLQGSAVEGANEGREQQDGARG